MMQVKMRTTAASATNIYQPGQVVDVADETAVAWLNSGYAEPVTQTMERATVEPKEKAVTNEPKNRNRSDK